MDDERNVHILVTLIACKQPTYQYSFGKLVVGREKRGPLVICDQCNWCYNHDVIMGFNTIIRTRTLEFTLEYDFSILYARSNVAETQASLKIFLVKIKSLQKVLARAF